MIPKHMLLTEIGAEDAQRFITDPRLLLQPKFDGDRDELFVHPERVFAISRSGKNHGVLPEVEAAAKQLVRDLKLPMLVLDGEQLDSGQFIVFDLLQYGDEETWKLPAEERADRLKPLRMGPILPTRSAKDTESKRALYHALWSKGAEGAVFKFKSTPYRAGTSLTAYKRKWVNDGTVISDGQNGSKSSFYMILNDGTELGTCTVSGDKPLPRKGQLVDVRYLYRYNEGERKLIQPRMLRLRPDLTEAAATGTQFYTKGAPRVGSPSAI